MCKGEYLSHILRKSSAQIYAGLSYIAFCVVFQEIYAADKKNLRDRGRTGRAKYQLWRMK